MMTSYNGDCTKVNRYLQLPKLFFYNHYSGLPRDDDTQDNSGYLKNSKTSKYHSLVQKDSGNFKCVFKLRLTENSFVLNKKLRIVIRCLKISGHFFLKILNKIFFRYFDVLYLVILNN